MMMVNEMDISLRNRAVQKTEISENFLVIRVLKKKINTKSNLYEKVISYAATCSLFPEHICRTASSAGHY
jgi:hypothetical protein